MILIFPHIFQGILLNWNRWSLPRSCSILIIWSNFIPTLISYHDNFSVCRCARSSATQVWPFQFRYPNFTHAAPKASGDRQKTRPCRSSTQPAALLNRRNASSKSNFSTSARCCVTKLANRFCPTRSDRLFKSSTGNSSLGFFVW